MAHRTPGPMQGWIQDLETQEQRFLNPLSPGLLSSSLHTSPPPPPPLVFFFRLFLCEVIVFLFLSVH